MSAKSLFFIDATVDRCNERRIDERTLGELQQADRARFLLVRRGRVKAVRDAETRVAWFRRDEVEVLGLENPTIVFLGMYDEAPRFALVPTERPLTADDRFQTNTDDDEYIGLRRAAMTMRAPEAQMAAHAVHLSNWLNRNRYCGSCAGSMQVQEGGHKLICASSACGREEFPRTDPVVIALVTRGSRCFLARQPKFPPKFYSALAGFVEPGETLENAVRREVREEAGVTIGEVAYVGSQPWPFPTSLMIGYLAQAHGEQFVLDHHELEDGRWFDRSEIVRFAAATPASPAEILLPPHGVMARVLIDEWLVRTA